MPPGTPPQASWEVKGVEVDGEGVVGPRAPGATGEDEEEGDDEDEAYGELNTLLNLSVCFIGTPFASCVAIILTPYGVAEREVFAPWAPGEDEEALALAPLGPF